MNLTHYLDSKLANFNVSRYDILYIYSDLRELGKYKPVSESKQEFLQQIIKVLLKNVSTVILGASKEDQLKENLKSLEYQKIVTDEIYQEIENIIENKPMMPAF